MVEIECPNCGARYQVPAEALGANGRDVTCSSCGNIWHALPVEDGPIDVSSIGVQTQPPRRSKQMAEIRQMLDQVQRGDRQDEGETYATQSWQEEDPRGPRARDDVRRAVFGQNFDDDDEIERTESFMRQSGSQGGQSARLRAVRGGDETRETDGVGQRKRMMSKHRRRNRKFEEAKRRGTGAGLTGFVLVAMVLGTLAGLYSFRDQISARVPGAQQPLATYAVVVDDLRADLQDRFSSLQGMISERVDSDEG
ncbi:MAG: zinc-ribbon domain-containing protein [Pseudomonadota bacterium]